MIGASDTESIEDVRYYGTISASSMEEKAFQDDEVKLALHNFGGITISKSLSEFDINPENPVFSYMNRVKIIVVPTGGGFIDDATKTRIRNYLRVKMDFTDFIEFIDPVYIDVRFSIAFDVFANTPSNFSAQVGSFLETEYALGKLDFGKSLDYSEVSYKLRTQFSQYVKRFTLILYVIEKETNLAIPTGSVSTRTLKLGNLRAGVNNIQPEKSYIYISYKKGTGTVYTEKYVDNELGAYVKIDASPADAILASSIDYITGAVSIMLKPAVTEVDSLEYIYQPFDVDGEPLNIDIKSTQIIEYDSTLVDVEVVNP